MIVDEYIDMVQFGQEMVGSVSMRKGQLVLMLLLLFAYQCVTPVQCIAFETRRVVLVSPADMAHDQSSEINRIIIDSLKRVFRYQFYEVAAQVPAPSQLAGAELAKRLAHEHNADIVILTEIIRLRDVTYSRCFWDDETWQETDLQLKVSTFTKANGQSNRFIVKRYQHVPLSVNSGVEQLVSDTMEEVLLKIPFKRVPET